MASAARSSRLALAVASPTAACLACPFPGVQAGAAGVDTVAAVVANDRFQGNDLPCDGLTSKLEETRASLTNSAAGVNFITGVRPVRIALRGNGSVTQRLM